MDTERKHGIGESLSDVVKSLGATLKAAYDLAPFAVVMLGVLSIGFVWLTIQWTPFMTGSAVILILILSIFF